MNPDRIIKIAVGKIAVFGDRIEITHGILTNKTVKTISLSNISSIKFYQDFLLNPCLEFGVNGQLSKENAVKFGGFSAKEEALEAKKFIEQRIGTARESSSVNVGAEIRELAKLKDEGIITEQEFVAGKARLLSS